VHAVLLLRELNLEPPMASKTYGEEDGIVVEHLPDARAVVDERGLERLRDAIRQHGLPIEIIETT
jgi:hypothetical protein